MGYYCTVPQCTSLAGKTKNVKFHRFPRDNDMALKWNTILKRGKPVTKYSKVCSLHFTPTDYNITTMGQWKTLSKDAIPTQNLPKLNPDGTVMVIRKSRTVKYKDCKKEEVSGKEEKFTSVAHTQPHLTDDVKQEDTETTLAYRLMCNLATELPKPRKQDATMQTDPILSEDEQSSMEINFDIDYDMPKDFSKQNEDFIPQTNEEYNKEAEKYALQRKHHSQYDQKVENYTKLPEVYNGFREKDYNDLIYQNTYTDSVEILRNQQHNLQMLQEQHRLNENQNFFNEDHIKQEIDFTNEEEKFLYERNKEQIDHSMYEHREQQSIIDHVTTVKQEPEVTGGCENVMQPQTSPYFPTDGATNVTTYYPSLSRPGPELLIAKQNALAAHTQLWQNQMKRPFFYSESTHYNSSPILHRCEDFSRIIQ